LQRYPVGQVRTVEACGGSIVDLLPENWSMRDESRLG
jgi:hypothetical protein